MAEWCRKHVGVNKEKKTLFPIDTGHINIPNFGCNLALPYGAAGIEHFLNASLLVAPFNRNIYIATDDAAWLHQALAQYKEQPGNLIHRYGLQLFPFHPRSGHRGLHLAGLNVSMDVVSHPAVLSLMCSSSHTFSLLAGSRVLCDHGVRSTV